MDELTPVGLEAAAVFDAALKGPFEALNRSMLTFCHDALSDVGWSNIAAAEMFSGLNIGGIRGTLDCCVF